MQDKQNSKNCGQNKAQNQNGNGQAQNKKKEQAQNKSGNQGNF